jgi:hypothetical protein
MFSGKNKLDKTEPKFIKNTKSFAKKMNLYLCKSWSIIK